ncbi:hypothetical protein [Nocardia aurantia]|uniref:DUF5709 domain-containing protein n=1 Tax=Nocardia aurantia TaxID=2585199 RepID=A0A7K0DR07_9NOCA|nr:hypothetical protein [Nocardia aurantia]MQY27792.1 hypothetical protein [Nocardia aurantia]
MPDSEGTWDPPQDTGSPDAVETDPASLSSAEDLDEDSLGADPLEQAMDPPEHPVGVDRYGTTPYEQAHPRPLGDRLAEETPDVGSAPAAAPDDDAGARRYREELGISADGPEGVDES